jgi:predicted transporter
MAMAALIGLLLSRLPVFVGLVALPLSGPALRNLSPAVIGAVLAFVLLIGVSCAAPLLALLTVRVAVYVGRAVVWAAGALLSLLLRRLGVKKGRQADAHAVMAGFAMMLLGAVFVTVAANQWGKAADRVPPSDIPLRPGTEPPSPPKAPAAKA